MKPEPSPAQDSTAASASPGRARGFGRGHIVALCGGVGGAKLALGLQSVLDADRLSVVVNTGDDFELLGLRICPDLDTVLYTLAGLNDPVRGWGRADESWNFMEALGALGGEDWFSLGDRDLALHVERTRRLRAGETLSSVTAEMAARTGVKAALLPMTDEPFGTVVHTDVGDLPFQRYFVKHRCEPVVSRISFAASSQVKASPAVLRVLADPELEAVVICPSNPFLSIDPILAVPGLCAALQATAAPVVAVSPLVGGKAVKGPTAKIMAELGMDVNTRAIAAHYAGLVDGLVVDESDASEAPSLGVPFRVTRTLMHDHEDRQRLAREVITFAASLAASDGSHRTVAADIGR